MKWFTLPKDESKETFDRWDERPIPEYDFSLEKLRIDIVNVFESCMKELGTDDNGVPTKGYAFDLLFGLRIYKLLNDSYGMTVRTASDDGVWRYLAIRLVPDLVYIRWGLKPERFWSNNRRVWLKTLWWYIHLSDQGSIEKTNQILKSNTSDEIVQLVERAGSYGYRVALSREIMKQFAPYSQKKDSSKLFRKVMKLNTARCKMIEPELVPGGTETYVRELFTYFETNDK